MKRYGIVLAKLFTSAGLLGLVFQQFDVAESLEVLARIGFGSVVAALMIGATQAVLHVHRWQLVARCIGTELHFCLLTRLTFIGFFFNQTLPTTFGGDAARIAMVRRYCPSLSRAVSSVLLDRVVALVALLGIIAVGLPFLPGLIDNPAMIWTLTLIVGMGIAGFGFVTIFGARGERFLARIPIVKGVRFLLGDFRRSLFSPSETPLVTVYSVAIHLLTCATIFVLANGMAVPLGFLESLLLVPSIILISIFPISFAGWGVREGAMIFLLDHIGVVASDALAISIAFGIFLIALAVPGCLIWLAKPTAT